MEQDGTALSEVMAFIMFDSYSAECGTAGQTKSICNQDRS